MKQVVDTWLWQAAMFGGFFLRPSVFLNGGVMCIIRLARRRMSAASAGVLHSASNIEAKVWFAIISFPESIDSHNFEVECQFGYPIWQKMLVFYWCLVSEVRIRWVSFLG
jgi:hypothetical protein